jgi:hypothetical protein
MRWEDHFKIEITEVRCEDGQWVELTQEHIQWLALVSALLNLLASLPDSKLHTGRLMDSVGPTRSSHRFVLK